MDQGYIINADNAGSKPAAYRSRLRKKAGTQLDPLKLMIPAARSDRNLQDRTLARPATRYATRDGGVHRSRLRKKAEAGFTLR